MNLIQLLLQSIKILLSLCKQDGLAGICLLLFGTDYAPLLFSKANISVVSNRSLEFRSLVPFWDAQCRELPLKLPYSVVNRRFWRIVPTDLYFQRLRPSRKVRGPPNEFSEVASCMSKPHRLSIFSLLQ